MLPDFDQGAATALHQRNKGKKSRPVSRVLSLDSHSSRPDVAVRLEQPTRERRGPRQMLPYLVLLQVGFAMPRGVGPARGALLPHRFTITTHALRRRSAVCSLLHYSVGSRRPGVTWHPALWSPDFPRSACAPRDCLADSAYIVACQTTIRRTVREEVVVEFVNPFALSVGAKRRSRRALARQAFRLRLLRKRSLS